MVFSDNSIPKPIVTDTSVINFITLDKNYKNLSEQEKEFYYWINYSRKNPKRFWDSIALPILQAFPQLKGQYSKSLKEDISNSLPLSMISTSPNLLALASYHANDICKNHLSPGHESSNGESFQQRFTKFNIKTCGSENVAFGSIEPIFALFILYLDNNTPNLGHRKTLLSPQYSNIGISIKKYDNNGTLFFVQDFSCSQ
jgi:hypothetical protein